MGGEFVRGPRCPGILGDHRKKDLWHFEVQLFWLDQTTVKDIHVDNMAW